MTICVSLKVHDGLIFAADSASSLVGMNAQGEPVVLNVWQHGNKVFNLYKGKPLAAMTCGMGHLGPASISNLAKDFRREITKGIGGPAIDPENYTVKEIAERARAFFEARYLAMDPAPPQPHSFEFWLGGYGAGCDHAEVWKVVIANGAVPEPELVADKHEDGHLSWGGQPKPIYRLIMGFDDQLGEVLMSAGLPPDSVGPLLEHVTQRTQTPLVHPAMPMQDAINLADFLVDVSKRYFSFLPGADVVGGETDIALVTKHEGFKWIRRKHHYSPALNPRETDHV